jgi:hypothetical protein
MYLLIFFLLALARAFDYGRLERVDATALPYYLPTFAFDDLVSLVHLTPLSIMPVAAACTEGYDFKFAGVKLLHVLWVFRAVETDDVVRTISALDHAKLSCPGSGCHSYDVFSFRPAAILLTQDCVS